MAACFVETPRYFHEVQGEAHFSGAKMGTESLTVGYPDYGAATYRPGSDRLSIHVDAGDVQISADASGVKEPGTYRLENTTVLEAGQTLSETPFQCIVDCEPCDVTVTDIDDDVIAGTMRCTGLNLCTEPTLPPDSLAGGACGQRTVRVLDVTADFRLSEPSSKRKDF
jgi:hypothetical protein